MARLLILPSLLLFLGTALAQSDPATGPVPADDPVMARLDELARLPWLKYDAFTADTAALNIHGFAPDEVPRWSAEVIAGRLKVLDERTPFALTYNNAVAAYIDLYAERKREQTSRMLGLAEVYFPVFEEALARHGLPMELKYLAVVESALNPAARSRAGAVGLWQFMPATGKQYGLTVDSYVDQRHELYQSTDAACRYLKDLYRIFNDWELAMAAYNCGPGNVNKAMRRSGGKHDYWQVYDWLPRETRGYVPAFIAVNYIMNHAADHNIYPVEATYCAHGVDTVLVCYPLSLKLLADSLGTPLEAIQELNPTFRHGYVPDMEHAVPIYLPRELIGAYIEQEHDLRYAYLNAALSGKEDAASTEEPPPARATRSVTHVVRSGENLGLIAQRNGVSVSDIKRWNGLRGDNIKPGQRLHLEKPAPAAANRQETEASSQAAPTPATNGNVEYIYHTVQPGDTLWDIANKYPGVSVKDLQRLNSGLNSKRLSPGKRIKVGVQQG